VTRDQLEHVIRAASQIVDDKELVVIGSQAVLGQFPDAPEALLRSEEADVFPKNKPELADLIDGTIGELSPFHEVFGYYAHGVSEDTAILPSGWKDRLVPLYNDNTRGATGWCLEIHDIVLSKLVAGREKDLDYAKEALRHRLLDQKVLKDRLAAMELIPEVQSLVAGRVKGLFRDPSHG
jgi:hypothetical protein